MTSPRLQAALAALALIASGCGGAGGSSGGGGSPIPPPANGYVTLQSQATTVALPPLNGTTGTITLPAGSGAVTIRTSIQPPSGIPALSTYTPIMYVAFTAVNGSVMMDQMPSFMMDMSGMMGSASYYMAAYMNGAWKTVEGPGVMMGGSQMSMGSNATPISLQNDQIECFAYYSGSGMGM